MDTALHTDDAVSDDFYYAVKNLPLTYNEKTYLQFIRNWGTHFIDSATLGGRLTSRYESTYSELYNFASENVQSSISAGGSYGAYSGSFKLDINKFNEQMSQSSTFGSKKATIHTGSKVVNKGNDYWGVPESDTTTPIPIKVTLKVITEAFKKDLWQKLPGGTDTYESLRITTKLEHVNKILQKYPVLENAPRSSDPAIIFPNAWPDGSYSFPKPLTGCPLSGNTFTWREGFIQQDNEDDDNNNVCPSPFKMAGFCSRNLKLYYCTKTVTSGDYGIKWPKGSYCIGKKGNCPKGFSSGYLRWDDEDDDGNINGIGGIIPDGTYGRNTLIEYCCRNDGHPHHKITLPKDKNFILIRNHRDGCQEVNGMKVDSMLLMTDDEDDRGNINESHGSYPWGAGGLDHNIRYCYYH